MAFRKKMEICKNQCREIRLKKKLKLDRKIAIERTLISDINLCVYFKSKHCWASYTLLCQQGNFAFCFVILFEMNKHGIHFFSKSKS